MSVMAAAPRLACSPGAAISRRKGSVGRHSTDTSVRPPAPWPSRDGTAALRGRLGCVTVSATSSLPRSARLRSTVDSECETITYEEEWRKYQNRARNKHADAFERNDGIIYLRDFLPLGDFEEVLAHAKGMRKSLKKEKDTIAKNRSGAYVKATSPVHTLMMNEAVAARLSEVVGEAVMASDYPVELREYKQKAQMDWHRDTQLFAKPQYELVFTLENESDSRTEWQDRDGHVAASEWTEPNSLIVVRAGGAMHRVTPLNKGRRSILKLCYTPTLERHENFGLYANQQY